MRIEVIVPYAGDCPYRSRALSWVRGRYPWPVTVATVPGGAWCKAAAVMPATWSSSADVLVVADADCWTDGIGEAVKAVTDGAAWAIPHRVVRRLSEACTYNVLTGAAPDDDSPLSERPYVGIPGGGIVVIHRDLLLSVPMDSRFVGWGQEDASWGIALRTMLEAPWRGRAPLWHLWHPPQHRKDRRRGSDAGWALYQRYRRASNDPNVMRALLAEIGGPHVAHEPDEPDRHDRAA